MPDTCVYGVNRSASRFRGHDKARDRRHCPCHHRAKTTRQQEMFKYGRGLVSSVVSRGFIMLLPGLHFFTPASARMREAFCCRTRTLRQEPTALILLLEPPYVQNLSTLCNYVCAF